MDYQYETLLDERFQMLCQSLLVREYPGVQCYPVGMPDGGRDAMAQEGSRKIVFQVKYSRNPASCQDPVKWIKEAIDGELDKIRKLAERGATSYVLMTNMPGTSHLDTGRMDKIQAYMDSKLPISGTCRWRDDIDRRLDADFDLKLKYPSLLSGTDLIGILWDSIGVGEERKRRSNALNAYFADQSDRDSKVRFKQADLSPSPLFQLFIDVPALPRANSPRHKRRGDTQFQRSVLSVLRADEAEESITLYSKMLDFVQSGAETYNFFGNVHYQVGAASLLLSHSFGSDVSRIVLEGAPGQGKSTLAQYLAQVHRARILQIDSVQEIPRRDTLSALMMPFKMELRDLATWIKGRDPWASGESTEHGRPRSLESAIAAHVERYSGGVRFDVSDLLFVIDGNAVLIILDALDEVADLDDRQRVVDEVTAAANRLESRNSNVKFVITSRPTAVAGSPMFDSEKFFHLALTAISPSLAMEYTRKWALARNLDDADLASLLSTLGQKLEAPHMAELAKNTMQLSILLSLTHLRGSTLPDKRTELYDAYIDVFLNREAEKDRTVRENRELLVNIHRFLGYYLHARAEVGGATGRISTEELRAVLTSFVQNETSDSPLMRRKLTELLDALLTGVVERIVALVSRVEGTYEFEVQPLREYFAAKYLYETAPYAPATRSQSGTKPDRFDGIAPNPYWLNVTRFFAGCFSKGELLDLADRAARLIEDSDPSEAAFPRTLALNLMQDWVFTQSTTSMKRIIQAVFDKPGIRWAALRDEQSGGATYGGGNNIELSPSAGYESLVDHFWPLVTEEHPQESLRAACAILRGQPENELLLDLWYREALSKPREELREWCFIGNWLGVLGKLGAVPLNGLLEAADQIDIDFIVTAFAEAGGDLKELDENLKHRALTGILNGVGAGSKILQRAKRKIDFLRMLDPELLYGMVFDRGFAGLLDIPDVERTASDPKMARYADLLTQIKAIQDGSEIQRVGYWRTLTSVMRATFGKTWREIEFANLAVSLKDPAERGAGAHDLFDENYSIVDRIRNARRRGGQLNWWLEQCQAASDETELALWLMASFSWGRGDVLVQLLDRVDQAIQKLGDDTYACLLSARDGCMVYAKSARVPLPADVARIRGLSWRTTALILPRLSAAVQNDVSIRFMRSRARDGLSGSIFLDHLSTQVVEGDFSAEEGVRLLASGIRRNIISRTRYYHDGRKQRKVLAEIRSEVIRHSWEMPSRLISTAYAPSNTKRRYRPVMEIADSEGWFK